MNKMRLLQKKVKINKLIFLFGTYCIIKNFFQVAGSIIGKGGQNITKLRSQVS